MEMGPYSSSNLNRTIAIAQYYGFWVVIDNHAYNDLQSQTSCWLNFWAGVISQFEGSYNKITCLQSQFRDKPPADIDRDGSTGVTDLITVWQNQFCN